MNLDEINTELFYKLCSVGNISILIDCINSNINIELSSDVLDNGIKNAILFSQYAVIKLFIEKYNIPAHYIFDIALNFSYYNLKIFRLLLKYNINPLHNNLELFTICCCYGWSTLLNTLLNKYKVNLHVHKYMVFAIKNDHINILKLLIFKCNIKIKDMHVESAIYHNSIDVIKYFIKMGVNINNELLCYAIKNQNEDAVKLFIDNKIDVCANNNVAIKAASLIFDTKIMKLIIKDINVDPTVDNNKPLCNSIIMGYYANVKYLLSLVNRPVNPTCNNYYPLKVAYNFCSVNDELFWTYYDILLLLYNDYRVDKQRIPEITLFITNMNTNQDSNSLSPLIPIDNIYLSPRQGRTDEIS